MEIQLIALHHLDSEGNYLQKNANINDGIEYVEELKLNIDEAKNMKEYEVEEDTKEVVAIIKEICMNMKSNAEVAASNESVIVGNINVFDEKFNKITKRLVNSQSKVRSRQKAMNQPQKGNLIQLLIENDEGYDYIIALIDSKKFIDEDDLKYKSGMLDGKETTLKSVKFTINKDNYKFEKIIVTDSSNKSISKYWCEEFLELKEVRSDISNTKCAYTTIAQVFSSTLSRKFKADYEQLKNALNVYFLHNNTFLYEECIGYLLQDYTPQSQEWEKEDLKQKLENQLNKGNFDTQFTINNKEINDKLQNTKYTINSNIELKVKKPIENMKESIYTDKLENGEKVLILKNVDKNTLDKFNFNGI